MTIFVDTSVWSLALRRDIVERRPEVDALQFAILEGDPLVTTGLVVQELLQGIGTPKSRALVLARLSSLPCLQAEREDHVDAASLRNECRRHGVQLGTVDALLAQLCVRHRLTMLTTDQDFVSAAPHCGLRLWSTSR